MLLLNNGFNHEKVVNYLNDTYFQSSPVTKEEIYSIIDNNVSLCLEGEVEKTDSELLDLLFENIPNMGDVKDAVVLPFFFEIILPKETGEDLMFDFPLIILEIAEVTK